MFSEIKKQQILVEKVIKEEENSFLRTLDNGLKRLDDIMNVSKEDLIDGALAFELYDTYGFPIDLTALILSESGKKVDMKGFEVEMNKQKDRARAASVVETEDWVVLFDSGTDFIGYDSLCAEVKVSQYRKVKQKENIFIN